MDQKATWMNDDDRIDGSDQGRSLVYCVVPRCLTDILLDPLRSWFSDNSGVVVIVERRDGERRQDRDRRRESAGPNGASIGEERRRIQSRAGRRIGDRRAISFAVPDLTLPRKARPYADRIAFLHRVEPTGQANEDVDSARLVVSAQGGDTSAFAALYERYFDRIYKYVRSLVHDAAAAEDTVQTVFERAMTALPRFELRPGHPVRSWLFVIARNEVMTHFRLEQAEVPVEGGELDALRERPSQPQWLEYLSDYEIALFVDRLPISQRQALFLRYVLDFSTSDIGHVLGRSPQAIRLLEHRALRTLESRLEGIGRVPPGRLGKPQPMRARLKLLPVLRERRFALGTHVTARGVRR
jgi:RNA polymerase sigma-70 factor (ECF subfamily)